MERFDDQPKFMTVTTFRYPADADIISLDPSQQPKIQRKVEKVDEGLKRLHGICFGEHIEDEPHDFILQDSPSNKVLVTSVWNAYNENGISLESIDFKEMAELFGFPFEFTDEQKESFRPVLQRVIVAVEAAFSLMYAEPDFH